MKRIGLFGGSFDPVHIGHLLVADAALEELSLERIFFIPARQSPFKPGTNPTSGGVRARMLRLALAGRPEFEVDEQELLRGGISYTIDTVLDFKTRFPGSEIFYLIGGDHVPQLGKWREAAKLAENVKFVVVPRPGQAQHEFPTPFQGSYLTGVPINLSASLVRSRVASGKPIQNLVPPAVAQVINEKRLYISEKTG